MHVYACIYVKLCPCIYAARVHEHLLELTGCRLVDPLRHQEGHACWARLITRQCRHEAHRPEGIPVYEPTHRQEREGHLPRLTGRALAGLRQVEAHLRDELLSKAGQWIGKCEAGRHDRNAGVCSGQLGGDLGWRRQAARVDSIVGDRIAVDVGRILKARTYDGVLRRDSVLTAPGISACVAGHHWKQHEVDAAWEECGQAESTCRRRGVALHHMDCCDFECYMEV